MQQPPTSYVSALEALLESEKQKEALRNEIEKMRSYQVIQEYPTVLKAQDVAKIMGVSIPTAYEYMRRSDFPLIDSLGNRRVLRDSFFKWLESVERKTG